MARRKRRVVWTDKARQALRRGARVHAQDSPEGAHTVLEQALAAASGSATLSERGRVVPEINDPAVREVFMFQYRLLYEVATSEVRILGLVHGASDFAKWRRLGAVDRASDPEW